MYALQLNDPSLLSVPGVHYTMTDSNPTFLTAADLRGSAMAYRATTIHDHHVDHAHYSNLAGIQQSDYLVVGNRIPPRTVPSGPMRPVFDQTREIRKDFFSERQTLDSRVYQDRATNSRRSVDVSNAATGRHATRFVAF